MCVDAKLLITPFAGLSWHGEKRDYSINVIGTQFIHSNVLLEQFLHQIMGINPGIPANFNTY
jgi:hypothetical protein